ncbi:hypothetical protein D3C86_1788150 [compost metagenome]
MGATVLDPGLASGPGLHVYAHAMRDKRGGVALLILNTDTREARSLSLPVSTIRYTLSASSLDARTVMLNGKPLQLGAGDALPKLEGVATAKGKVTFAPTSITFLTVPQANNPACR